MRTYISRTRELGRLLRRVEEALGFRPHSLAVWQRLAKSGNVVYALGYDNAGRMFPDFIRDGPRSFKDVPLGVLEESLRAVLAGAATLTPEERRRLTAVERLKLAYRRGRELERMRDEGR